MTLKIFQKCDNKYDWSAYVRFGLYFVMRNGTRTNFCDIHLGWVPGNEIDLGVFSGPKDSTNDITRYTRSADAAKRYRVEHKVNSDLALTSGGVAKIIHSLKRKTYDVWLFGPLLFNDLPYGSLVAELKGLQLPKHGHKFTPIDQKTGKERESTDPKYQRYIVNFPKNYGLHFHPCNLQGVRLCGRAHPVGARVRLHHSRRRLDGPLGGRSRPRRKVLRGARPSPGPDDCASQRTGEHGRAGFAQERTPGGMEGRRIPWRPNGLPNL